MLKRVLTVVAARGWFDTATPFETTVNLTRGACLWLLLSRRGVSDTYVKFSEHVSLELEARRCAAASRSYPGLVPAFIGHASSAGLDVLVCRAVDYRALDARAFARPSTRMLADLLQYFTVMRSVVPTPELAPLPNAELAERMRSYFALHPLARVADAWLCTDAAARAAALPDVPQHGDLVPNNIGQTDAGRAVVFDWEDFSACCLPGLDLFTLEFALAGNAAALLGRRSGAPDAGQRFVQEACTALGIDLADYHALTPVYALAFRYLKRNYGPGVRARVDELLTDLAAARA
jgi:hypothetical protein